MREVDAVNYRRNVAYVTAEGEPVPMLALQLGGKKAKAAKSHLGAIIFAIQPRPSGGRRCSGRPSYSPLEPCLTSGRPSLGAIIGIRESLSFAVAPIRPPPASVTPPTGAR
ncbi:hypothetical protein MRX96_019031 [Rhipicephalus microplus]